MSMQLIDNRSSGKILAKMDAEVVQEDIYLIFSKIEYK